jgi:hypothetical protein
MGEATAEQRAADVLNRVAATDYRVPLETAIADAIKAAEAAAYERAAQVADAERTASGGIIAAAIRRLAEPRAGR